jgi:D-hexose-6-phosphate mutarotase
MLGIDASSRVSVIPCFFRPIILHNMLFSLFLSGTLSVRNLKPSVPMSFTTALHTYFAVSEINQVRACASTAVCW